MDDLIKGIMTAYNANEAKAITLRAVSPGGIWLNEAPQTITGTYIIISPLASPMDFVMSGDYTAECTIQFLFCSPSNANNAVAAKDAFVSLFSGNLITLSSYSTIYARPTESGSLERDPDSSGYSIPLTFRWIIGNK